jgi:hypothetical protein
MRSIFVFFTLVVSLQLVFGKLLYTLERSSAKKLIPGLMGDIQRTIARDTFAGRPTANLEQHLNALQHIQVSMLAPTSCMEKFNYKYVQTHFKSAAKILRRGGNIDSTMRSAWENYFLNLKQCTPIEPSSGGDCCAGGGCCYPVSPYQPTCCCIYVGDGPGDGGCCDGGGCDGGGCDGCGGF